MGKWEMVRLGDVGKVITGNTPPKKNKEYYDSCDIPFFKPNDFKNDEVTTLSITTESISEQARNKARILPPNSILVTCIGTIGKVGITVHECSFNQQINAIIPNNNCISVYLGYAIFHKRQYLESIANAPVVPIINKTNFSDVKIPLPPLEIQQKIATTLDTAAAILKLRQQQLAELDAVIQSVFYQMFGDPVRNEKGWERIIFGELGNFKNGINYRSNESKYEVKCLSVGDFKDYKMITDTGKLKSIILEEKPKQEILLKKDDLIFVRSNGSKSLVGRCVLIADLNEELTFSGFCIRFRKSYSELNAIFLNEFFNLETIHRILTQDGRGCSINNLNQDLLSKVKIPLPPLSLQTQFAAIVQKIDQQKALVQQSIDETQTLFDSLMSQYFD